jgi:hypothetical protein
MTLKTSAANPEVYEFLAQRDNQNESAATKNELGIPFIASPSMP